MILISEGFPRNLVVTNFMLPKKCSIDELNENFRSQFISKIYNFQLYDDSIEHYLFLNSFARYSFIFCNNPIRYSH